MQYLLMIYEEEARTAQGIDPAELQGYDEFVKKHRPRIRGGNALEPTATAKSVRVRNGEPLVSDGPYVETKEQLGGYFLVEAENDAEALAMAAELPGARFGGVEVRPIMVFSQHA